MNREIKDLLEKKEILEHHELQKIAELILLEKDLKVNDIYFTLKSPEYNFGNNTLGLSNNYNSDWLNQELDEFKCHKYLKMIDKIDEVIIDEKLINSILVFLTYHEIRHAEQNKILSETYEKYDKTYVKYLLISLLKSTQLLRKLYHDKLYFEFDANMNAIINLKDNETIKRYLAYKIMVSYTNKSGTAYIDPISANKNTFGTSLSGLPNFDVTAYLNGHNDEIEESFQLGSILDENKLENIKKVYQKGIL